MILKKWLKIGSSKLSETNLSTKFLPFLTNVVGTKIFKNIRFFSNVFFCKTSTKSFWLRRQAKSAALYYDIQAVVLRSVKLM